MVNQTIGINSELKKEIKELVKLDDCKFYSARQFVNHYIAKAIKKEKKDLKIQTKTKKKKI